VRVLPGRTAELRFNLSSDAVVARVVPAVIWVPDWKGIPSEAQKLLAKALEQSVAKQKLSTVRKEAALVQAPRLADCLDQLPCQEQLATQNEAGYTLSSSIEATGDLVRGDWTLKLALVDAPTGDYAALVDKRCERCTADQVSAALEEATTALLQKGAARPRGTLEVISDPPGADVLLTDRRLGQTPYLRAAFAGSYDVTVKLAGYALSRQHIGVEEGKKASTRLTLTQEGKTPPPVVVEAKAPPTPPPTPPVVPPPSPQVQRQRRPLWRLATGGALLAAGGLLAVYGISGLAANGQPAFGGTETFNSLVPGGAFLGVGLVLAAGGAVLVALPGPRRARQASLRLNHY
jgi:hypothetical protein